MCAGACFSANSLMLKFAFSVTSIRFQGNNVTPREIQHNSNGLRRHSCRLLHAMFRLPEKPAGPSKGRAWQSCPLAFSVFPLRVVAMTRLDTIYIHQLGVRRFYRLQASRIPMRPPAFTDLRRRRGGNRGAGAGIEGCVPRPRFPVISYRRPAAGYRLLTPSYRLPATRRGPRASCRARARSRRRGAARCVPRR
jgi:hypothetical protein